MRVDALDTCLQIYVVNFDADAQTYEADFLSKIFNRAQDDNSSPLSRRYDNPLIPSSWSSEDAAEHAVSCRLATCPRKSRPPTRSNASLTTRLGNKAESERTFFWCHRPQLEASSGARRLSRT